jgi:hypothetical protein
MERIIIKAKADPECSPEFLEAAAWDRIALLKRRRRESRDRRILDRKARALNSEAIDVLGYQADW